MTSDRDALAKRFAQLRDASIEEVERGLPWVQARLAAHEHHSPDDTVRALELLGFWGEMRRLRTAPGVAEMVAQMLESEHVQIRKETCTTLALLRSEPAFDASAALVAALRDPEPMVRQEAAAALGDLASEGAREPLARGLADPDAGVRFESAFALATLSDGRARPVLESALGTRSYSAFAIEGLRKLGDAAAAPALERFAGRLFVPWPEQLAAWATLAGWGHEGAKDRLARKLQRGRVEVRGYAIYLVGHAGLQALRTEVLAIADDARSPLRATAVRAIGQLGRTEDNERLQGWLFDETCGSDVRLEALEALVERGPRAELQADLEAGRLDTPSELRRRAIELLR